MNLCTREEAGRHSSCFTDATGVSNSRRVQDEAAGHNFKDIKGKNRHVLNGSLVQLWYMTRQVTHRYCRSLLTG